MTNLGLLLRALSTYSLISVASTAVADCSPAEPFTYNGNCYETLDEAEAVLRGISTAAGAESETQDWRIYFVLKQQVGETYYYHLPPRPHLPNPSWKTQFHKKYQSWGWKGIASPNFGTYQEAEAWLDEYAGVAGEHPPGYEPTFYSLQHRGTWSNSQYDYRVYSDPILDTVPTTFDDSAAEWRYCTDFAPGVASGRIGRTSHSIYQLQSAPTPPVMNAVVNNCSVNGVWWRIYMASNSIIQEQNIGPCQSPYVSDGTQCISNALEVIHEGGTYALEPPPLDSCESRETNETNPCNPANGNKFLAEVDYSLETPARMEFVRYYNSTGALKSDADFAPGWRHTYSRKLDEHPDTWPTISRSAPENQSSFYYTPEEACESGWGDIKSDVWNGTLSSFSAAYLGSDLCRIEDGTGTAKAYFSVRSAVPSSGPAFTAGYKTVSRPNGSREVFRFNGSEWVNDLNPSVSLEQVGSNYVYTDENDNKEIYETSSGHLLSITTRSGVSTTITYGTGTADSGKPKKVTDSFGNYINIYYTYPTGELYSVDNPSNGRFYYYFSGDLLTRVEQYQVAGYREYLYERDDLPAHLTGIVDSNDSRFATYDYDDAGRAILSEHFGGKERVLLTYNSNGSTTLAMADGATRTYHYSAERGNQTMSMLSGNVCASCPGGSIAARSFDANGFVDETQDWNGVITETSRNSLGQVETLVEAKGTSVERTTSITWHATYNLPLEIVSALTTTNFTYDTAGNVTSLSITDGTDTRSWSFTHNGYGQVLTADGPRTDVSDVTTFTYHNCTTGSKCGQIATITNALGHVTQFIAYDGAGRVTQVRDPNNFNMYFTYFQNGKIREIRERPTTGSSRYTNFTYNNLGLLATVSTPQQRVLTYTYDDAHYLRTVTDNHGNRIEYDYDSMGRLTQDDAYDSTNTLKKDVEYTYNLNGWIDSTSNATYVTDIVTDMLGNITTSTDPNLDMTQHVFDALNRLESTIDAMSGVVEYEYDVNDNVSLVTAANGAETSYDYDAFGNLLEETSPDRGTTEYTYDLAGNRLTMLDARGKLTTYEYDALNRLILETLDGSDTITYQYDVGTNAIGRRNKITDTTGQTTWVYNNFGEVTNKTQTIGGVSRSTSYSYDGYGRLSAFTLPSGKYIVYTYSSDLPVAMSMSVVGQILSGAIYDPFGRAKGWTWGNSTVHSRTFDTRGLLTGQSMVTDSRTLTYDPVGRPITLDDSRHDLGFDYNALGQITDFTAAGSAPLTAQEYGYDGNGNRDWLIQNSTTYDYSLTTFTNRLVGTTGPTGKTYSYDAAGNITGDGIHTYGYDDRGRLSNVDSGAINYEHNGLGQRVKKVDGSAVTLFVYDETGNLVGEYNGSGTPIREHVWFNGAPVAVVVGSAKYYVHTDHLGTPRIVTNGNTPVWRWESGPFGEEAAQEDPDNDMTDFIYNLRFPGQYYDDETGLHYNYFRTYDPSTGRYLESDPIGLNGGLNTYGYVSANPLSSTDPFGLYEGGGVAEVLGDPSAQAAARARAAAAQQRRAQKEFEEYQRLCRLYGGTNCDAPQDCPTDEASVEAWRTFIDIFSLSSGVYGTSRIPGSRLTVRPNVPYEPRWNYGTGKSAEKWARQMQQRGWTESQISEALSRGQAHTARNNINPANGATRYVHPETGRSVVIDNTTRELIHVGGDGYRY